jgi:hypothetical protein
MFFELRNKGYDVKAQSPKKFIWKDITGEYYDFGIDNKVIIELSALKYTMNVYIGANWWIILKATDIEVESLLNFVTEFTYYIYKTIENNFKKNQW